jgi:RES domain-containing protein
MTRTRYWFLPALALASACSKPQAVAEPEQVAALTFHEIMKDQIDKNADELWDISNASIGDRAGLDPAKMNDAQWQQLTEKAEAVRSGALAIVAMNPLVIAKPGVKISDEGLPGGHTAAMVQARFDMEPEKLRDLANTLASHMDELAQATRAKNPEKAGPLIDQLDGVCESCHLEFWYPDQKELVQSIIDANK